MWPKVNCRRKWESWDLESRSESKTQELNSYGVWAPQRHCWFLRMIVHLASIQILADVKEPILNSRAVPRWSRLFPKMTCSPRLETCVEMLGWLTMSKRLLQGKEVELNGPWQGILQSQRSQSLGEECKRCAHFSSTFWLNVGLHLEKVSEPISKPNKKRNFTTYYTCFSWLLSLMWSPDLTLTDI